MQNITSTSINSIIIDVCTNESYTDFENERLVRRQASTDCGDGLIQAFRCPRKKRAPSDSPAMLSLQSNIYDEHRCTSTLDVRFTRRGYTTPRESVLVMTSSSSSSLKDADVHIFFSAIHHVNVRQKSLPCIDRRLSP